MIYNNYTMDVITAGQNILAELGNSFNRLHAPQVSQLVEEIRQAKRIFCVGAGRSRVLLNAFCMRLNHLGLEAYVAGNIPCPPAKKGDLIVASSGSGATPSVNAILKAAHGAGARIALITASPASDPAEIADIIVDVKAPNALVNRENQESSQLMRTLFEQVCFILYDSIITVLSANVPREEIAARHTNLE